MALYNIYRPQNFDEIVGQNAIKKILTNAILQNKIAGAYLFVGPKGIGKTTIARILAKSICCQNRKENEYNPCNKCDFCKNITEGNFIDVIEIDAASHRTIDETKSIIENIKYHPTLASKKIYIIDECHMLTKESFNALLKTLEEPPSHVHFILATTDVHKIPITIISRCQRFDLQRISIDDIVYKLAKILKSQNIEHEEEALKIIAKQSQGGLRDAEVLLEQIITSLSEKDVLTVDKILNILNLLPINIYEDLIDLIYNNQVDKVIQQIHNLYINGVNIENFFNNWISFLRDKMIEKASKNEPIDFYISLIEILLDSKKFYHIESNPIMFLEIAIMRFITKNKKVSINNQIDNNKEEISINKIPYQHTESFISKKVGEININDFKKQWINLINDKSLSSTLKNILKICVFKELLNNTLIFSISNKSMLEKLNDISTIYNITNLVKKYISPEYNIKFIYEENIKAKQDLYKTDKQLSKLYNEKKISAEEFANIMGGIIQEKN